MDHMAGNDKHTSGSAHETPPVGAMDARLPLDVAGGLLIFRAEDTRLVFISDNLLRMFECETEQQLHDMCGGMLSGLVLEEDMPLFEDALRSRLAAPSGSSDRRRYRMRTRAGHERFVDDFGTVIATSSGEHFICCLILDVSSLTATLNTDPLTGLASMTLFLDHARRRIERESPVFVYFDIDNLSFINERFGFEAGTRVLMETGEILARVFEGDMVSRFSEDHFVCLTQEEGLREKLDLVHSTVHDINGSQVRVDMRVGIYSVAEEQGSVSELSACNRARAACAGVTEEPGCWWRRWDDNLRRRTNVRRYLAGHLDRAIRERHIRVLYQPILDIGTGTITGFEALSRWVDPQYGAVMPGVFIPMLEQRRIVHQLDLHVLDRVCRDMTLLRELGHRTVPVSFNLSRLDFSLCDIVAEVESLVKRYGVPRQSLCLEITEGALSDDSDRIYTALSRFQDLGYFIWMDDFGSGYSSLNVLKDFDFDLIKLHRNFLKGMEDSRRSRRSMDILRSILSMARHLSMLTLAEGVETAGQLEILRNVGCDCGQGYFIGQPMTLDDTLQLGLLP